MNPFDGYRITSVYGWRIHPISKTREFHAGIDLVKSHKSPIISFTDGVVQFAEEKRGTGFGGMGIVVAVKDENGFLHCYAHLDSASVKVGQIVKRGQEIGKQGSTGTDSLGRPTSTGSHLHYEVRPKASPNNGWHDDPQKRSVDPAEYLVKFYAAEAKEEMPEMNPEDANKIIRYLSASWFVVQGNKEAEQEFNRLANELRKASGQKVQ